MQTVRTAQPGILKRLSEWEASIGKLYRAYSQLSPRMAFLWDHLAREEEKHAQTLLVLLPLLGKN